MDNANLPPGARPAAGPTLSQTTPVNCEQCGNSTFVEVVLVRKLSALISPNGQEAFAPIPVFACNACGHVNNDFLPAPMRRKTGDSNAGAADTNNGDDKIRRNHLVLEKD